MTKDCRLFVHIFANLSPTVDNVSYALLMRNPPIHRQIFFWTAILTFFIVAPSVVFYTAGYRWNPKKGAIERNGTLIIDTTPVGAKISLNGQEQIKVSPVTIKNLSPGTYRIHLSFNGYHSWTKTVQLLPERVTFANNIILWLNANPKLVASGIYGYSEISPNGKYAIAVKQEGEEKQVVIIELATGKETVVDMDNRTSSIDSFAWSDDSSAILISRSGGVHELIVRRNASVSMELPLGTYRWENGMLIGALDGERYVYDISNDTAQRDSLGQGVKDVLGDYQIIAPTGTRSLALIERGGDVRFDLPAGDWRFSGQYNDFVYLRSGDDWLAFDPGHSKISAIRFKSEVELRSMNLSKNTELLSRYGGELSVSKPGQLLDLLVRKSDQIIGAFWHESGRYVLYATNHEVIALDLDARDHRIETILAGFDEITGFSYQKREVIVIGKKGDQQGVWKLAIE